MYMYIAFFPQENNTAGSRSADQHGNAIQRYELEISVIILVMSNMLGSLS